MSNTNQNQPTHDTQDTISAINVQLQHVEQLVHDLLTGLDVDDLSAHHRLSHAIKFMEYQSHLLRLRQTCEQDDPAQQEQTAMASLRRFMRGEEEM